MPGPWEKYQRGGPTVLPAPPKQQYEVPRIQGQIDNTATNTARTRQQMHRDNALLPADIRLKNAQANKAEAEAAQSSGLDKQKLANIRAAQSQVDRLRALYKKGPGRTKGFSSILDYIPTDDNSRFDTAGAGLGEVGLAAFRVPGVGSQSDTELRAFIDANRPSSWDRDAEIEEKLNNLQNRLNETYAAYGMKRPGGGSDGWKIEPIE